MPKQSASPLAGDRIKKAINHFCELLESAPQKSRLELLHQVELRYDLSPMECEFLNNHLAQEKTGEKQSI